MDGATAGKDRPGQASPLDLAPRAERIFISYSRKDGAAFAADPRKRLTRKRFAIWQDIVSLEGGRDWWSQIEETLKSKALEHFVLVVTPKALESEVMRREIRLARHRPPRGARWLGPRAVPADRRPPRIRSQRQHHPAVGPAQWR
jgi:hypothetical protein